MKKNKKLLPVEYPLNTTWTFHAGLISILSNHESTLEWILSNYIQIYCREDKRKPNHLFMDFAMFPNHFKQCPWVKTQDFDRETINLFHKDIISFFIESIENNNYLYGIFDESQFYDNYKGDRFLHELFIFGYDCESQIFNVADFTFSHTGSYSYAEIPFEKIEKAFKVVEPHDDYLHDDRTALSLIKFNNWASYSFDSYFVKRQLTDYLNAEEDLNYRRYGTYVEKTMYGIAVYDYLYEYLENLIKNKIEFDIKAFHFLYIHKLYMLKRIIYMKENGWILLPFNDLDDWHNLKKALVILRNNFIKYNRNKKTDILHDTKNMLMTIKSTETKLIENLIKKIII